MIGWIGLGIGCLFVLIGVVGLVVRIRRALDTRMTPW